jgi:hypothetical protein
MYARGRAIAGQEGGEDGVRAIRAGGTALILPKSC